MTEQEQESAEQKLKKGIDFNQLLYGLDGDPLQQNNGTEKDPVMEDVRLGEMCRAALVAPTKDNPDQVQILKRFNLAMRLSKRDDDDDFLMITLRDKHKKMILKQAQALVGLNAWSTVLFARMYEALMGDTDEEELDGEE